MSLFILTLSSWHQRLFASDQRIRGWERVADSWVAWLVIIAVLITIALNGYKFWLRRSAKNLRAFNWLDNRQGLTWTPGQTWLLIIAGLILIFLLLVPIYFSSRDFTNVIGMSGLGLGIVFSCLLHIILMVLIHLVVRPWKRHLHSF